VNRRDWLWVLLFVLVISVAIGLPEVVVPAHLKTTTTVMSDR